MCFQCELGVKSYCYNTFSAFCFHLPSREIRKERFHAATRRSQQVSNSFVGKCL